MPQQKDFRALIQTWTVSGILFASSLSGIISHPALAQADLRSPSGTAVDHAPAVVDVRVTPAPRSMTPQEVANGTATLMGRYNPSAKLRVVLGLNPPNMPEEERFLQQLQDKKSPSFHKYLTAKQWNARFAPTVEQEQAVVDWATSNGLTITQRYENRLIVD